MTAEDVPQQAQEVLDYWFGPAPAATAKALETKLSRWFGDPQVADEVRARFAPSSRRPRPAVWATGSAPGGARSRSSSSSIS